MTHIEALELDTVPAHLIVIGGGYIGLELAQAFRRFGSSVTIIERNGHLAHREDADVSQALEQLCHDEGMNLATNVKIARVDGRSGGWVRVVGTRDGQDFAVEGTHLLVAGGRTPNTGGMGLDKAGVELTGARLREGERAAADHRGGNVGHRRLRRQPALHPHLLRRFPHRAGQHHRRQPRDDGPAGAVLPVHRPGVCAHRPERDRGEGAQHSVSRGEDSALAVLRTRTLSETRGFLKALVAADSDQILGFMMFGVEAGGVMATVQVAMLAGLPYTALRDAVMTHPTMQEGLVGLFSAVPARAS